MKNALPRSKGLAMTGRIDCHDFLARSLPILLSLRGAKRRSNPERKSWYNGLPRPKGLAIARKLHDNVGSDK